MDKKHLMLQYQRLLRHYERALRDRDQISFLDLAHSLRIWVDMKAYVDEISKTDGRSLTFKNSEKQRELNNILKGSDYTYIPLASGVKSSGVEVKAITFTNRALTPEEIKRIFELGLPKEKTTTLSFQQWLGSSIIMKNVGTNKVSISREIMIKRVANILGASHPMGTDEGENFENRFDEHIKELNNIVVADGYPVTYYQLIEIADEIIEAMKEWLNS